MSSFRPHIAYGAAELLLMRCAFALVIASTFMGREFFASQPYPNGIAHLFDLSVIAEPVAGGLLRIVFATALVSYAVGFALPASTAALFGSTVWIGTLANSQGAIGHGNQIVSLVLLGQLCAYLRPALGRLSGGRWTLPPGIRVQDVAVHYSQQMIAAVYVTAGVVKIIRSRGRWIVDLPDISVQIVKTHSQRFYDHLEPGLVERGEQIASAILANPNLARVLLSGGLLLELGAFLALRGRVGAFVVGAALVAMHQGIELLMMLSFRTNQLVVLIFLVNVPFLITRVFARYRSARNSA